MVSVLKSNAGGPSETIYMVPSQTWWTAQGPKGTGRSWYAMPALLQTPKMAGLSFFYITSSGHTVFLARFSISTIEAAEILKEEEEKKYKNNSKIVLFFFPPHC